MQLVRSFLSYKITAHLPQYFIYIVLGNVDKLIEYGEDWYILLALNRLFFLLVSTDTIQSIELELRALGFFLP